MSNNKKELVKQALALLGECYDVLVLSSIR